MYPLRLRNTSLIRGKGAGTPIFCLARRPRRLVVPPELIGETLSLLDEIDAGVLDELK